MFRRRLRPIRATAKILYKMAENKDAVVYCEQIRRDDIKVVLSPVLINNVPHFVAVEVCEALDLSNPTDRLKSLDDDEKLTYVLDRAGQKCMVNLVTGSGLYHLIFISRKAEARVFRKWVTNEVLPSIRKTGRYGMGPKALGRPRVKPRDRSAELGVFFRELRLWVRSSDVDETAAMMGVGRSHVLQVLGGTKPGVDVLEILVAYAKENRKRGRLTDIRNAASAVRRTSELTEQLRIDFMDGYTCIGKEGGKL